MVSFQNKEMKTILDRLEKNPAVRFITISALVIGAVITIGKFLIDTKSYLYRDIFIEKDIEEKIYPLSAGQSINFFKDIFGTEIIQRKISDTYVEHIFQLKKAFIQTVSDNSDEVIYWAITYCGDSYLELPRKNLGGEIILNKSTIVDVYKDDIGEFNYFISGATANSYAYESLYLANPGGYQTVILGSNDICPDFSFLDWEEDKSNVDSYRKYAKINTYAETSPFKGEEIIELLKVQNSRNPEDSYLTFGVDRIKVRIFNSF